MFNVTVHDITLGDVDLGSFKTRLLAHKAARKHAASRFQAFSYTLSYDPTRTTVETPKTTDTDPEKRASGDVPRDKVDDLPLTVLVGQEIGYAVRDLRCFAYLHPSNRLHRGRNFDERGFRLLVKKGYVRPINAKSDHVDGYWEMTPRGERLGRYLRTRFHDLKAKS